MNVQKLKESLEQFKNDLGESLLSSDIWDKRTSLSVASYNSNKKYAALFNRLTLSMEQDLKALNLSKFGQYQLIDLDNETMLLLLNIEEKYLWGSLVDKTNLSLGFLIYIVIPKAQTSLKMAIL